MGEYLAPGVFLEEVELKPPSIEGVSTSTTGMVGAARRGPVAGRPSLVTNMKQFRDGFGGPFEDPAMIGKDELYHAADGFFANGGRRLYVVRASGPNALAAAAQTQGGLVLRLAEDAPVGAGMRTVKVRPGELRGLAKDEKLTLTMVLDGVTYSSAEMTVADNGLDMATGTITLTADLTIAPAGPIAFKAPLTGVVTRFIGLNANQTGNTANGQRPNSLLIEAKEPGSWGDDIVMTARPSSSARGELDAVVAVGANNNRVRLKSAAGFYVNAWVEIDRGNIERTYRKVTAINGAVLTLDGQALANVNALNPVAAPATILRTCEFDLSVAYGDGAESHRGLTLEDVQDRNVQKALEARSKLVKVKTMPAGTHPFLFPSGADGRVLAWTAAGTDVAPGAADIRGVDNGPGTRTGLRALEEIDDISIICAPGWGDQSVQAAMIEQCERLKYRVAFLDPEPNGSVGPTLDAVRSQRLRFDSKYAALYFPRVAVPVTAGRRMVGPSGHMAGLCARIDNERGVFKAPANEVIRNVLDLETIVTRGEHETLNPNPVNINVFRDFRNEGRGLRIYGARCITSANDWKYLSVRRLFIFIERSLEIGTQWAVMEPNDQRLWSKLIDSVDAFLTRVWRDGGLMGEKKSQAFYIRCGLDTMTIDDVDNGRLIMEIGIAPVKPAEFVIIRIGQWAGGSFTEEL